MNSRVWGGGGGGVHVASFLLVSVLIDLSFCWVWNGGGCFFFWGGGS